MKIIDSFGEYEEFIKNYQSSKGRCLLIPILSDHNLHPCENRLSFIYIFLNHTKFIDSEYILPFNHTEAVCGVDLEKVKYDLNTEIFKYTYDKKKLSHFMKLKNMFDINLLHYMNYNEPLYIEDITTPVHDIFYNKYRNERQLNDIIPIMKHIEYCRKLLDKFSKYHVTAYMTNGFDKYNEEVLDNLQHIESNGLMTLDGLKHTEYNIYTSTGRPSNRFGGINYAALNKTDGSRKKFVSRFGSYGNLVEFDYDAYHLRLIADIVGYEFPKESVHKYMSKYYKCDYEKSKKLSFKYLYGKTPKEVIETNDFFRKVEEYKTRRWDEYRNKEFILTDIYNKRIFRRNLFNMNKNKLFNYLIQVTETENNMKMLNTLIPKLNKNNVESKLILYSYDSFLFDYDNSDGENFLQDIKNEIEHEGKYPTSVSVGKNYHEMVDVTEKFNEKFNTK